MDATLLSRIMPTFLGALLNVFAMVYFIRQGGNMVYMGAAHAAMVILLGFIVVRKYKAARKEQQARR
jgi:hypothetical protein